MNNPISRAVVVACALLTGCATAYQSGKFSLTGGYIDQPVTDRLTKVTFSANGFTSVDTAVTYARFRCAELAQAKNRPFFIMYGSLNAAVLDRPAGRPAVGTLGAKPAAFAYVMFIEEERPGAQKTSAVLAEFEAFKRQQQEEADERRRKREQPKKKERASA